MFVVWLSNRHQESTSFCREEKARERNIYSNNLLYMLGLGKERPSLYPAVQ